MAPALFLAKKISRNKLVSCFLNPSESRSCKHVSKVTFSLKRVTCFFFLNLLPVYIKLVTCLMKDELLLLVLLHIIDKLVTRLKIRRQHDMYRGIQIKS